MPKLDKIFIIIVGILILGFFATWLFVCDTYNIKPIHAIPLYALPMFTLYLINWSHQRFIDKSIKDLEWIKDQLEGMLYDNHNLLQPENKQMGKEN